MHVSVVDFVRRTWEKLVPKLFQLHFRRVSLFRCHCNHLRYSSLVWSLRGARSSELVASRFPVQRVIRAATVAIMRSNSQILKDLIQPQGRRVAARRGRESDYVSRIGARALGECAHMGGIVVDAKGFSIPCGARGARVCSYVLAVEGGCRGASTRTSPETKGTRRGKRAGGPATPRCSCQRPAGARSSTRRLLCAARLDDLINLPRCECARSLVVASADQKPGRPRPSQTHIVPNAGCPILCAAFCKGYKGGARPSRSLRRAGTGLLRATRFAFS